MILSGGCQCGAVRFAVEESAILGAGLCHCRMCQKQFSSPYAALVTVRGDGLTWTAGERSLFCSSAVAQRGFCNQCGSPLTWEGKSSDIDLAMIAFDDPHTFKPTDQSSQSTRILWTDDIATLPWRTATFESMGIVSFQHPDSDNS
jgi:hypothetical protein